MHRCHWDWALLQKLVGANWQEAGQLGVSILVPSVGSFASHWSGTAVNEAHFREALWQNDLVQQGTERADVARGLDRRICNIPEEDNLRPCDVLRVVKLPEELDALRHGTPAAAWTAVRTDWQGIPRHVQQWRGATWEYVGGHNDNGGWRVVQVDIPQTAAVLGEAPRPVTKRQRRVLRANTLVYAHRFFEEAPCVAWHRMFRRCCQCCLCVL